MSVRVAVIVALLLVGCQSPEGDRCEVVYHTAELTLDVFNLADRKVDANVHWDNRADWYEEGLAAPRKTEEEMKRK